MTTSLYDRHLDTSTMIWDATSMFLSSSTAQGKSSRAGLALLGRRVAQALKKKVDEGSVTYSKGNRAHVREGRSRITIDYRLSNSLAGTSIRLVHEALHLVQHYHQIDEELVARRLEIMYFQDLLNTRWKYRARSGQREWSVQLRRGDPVDDSLQLTDMERFDVHHQLVDYVLRAEGYEKEIDAKWVRETLRRAYWGGLTNRWPETRGLYVAKLAGEGGRENARVVKQIVKSLLDLNQFKSPSEYRYPYKLTNEPLTNFALWVAGGLTHSPERGWEIVRKALKPLLRDSSERKDLEHIESQLSRPGKEIFLTRPPGPPKPPQL